ncbi:MFS transporter [Eubacterium aggregans]|uniref:Predicted arabinose efflux permease, MFS family n=1 Tax=Eubacterium aggregans TaxID=81409 RepID=A0A1H3ZBJ8_9FIRM|nr:MFS transporter [Eubacterium aggregans]MDD4691997.1 MFS transporter [Eubacterium aggregans]SEA20985.1 Predicted arabinose efflux permease, MFS family [Eubacterium aggregans]
MNTKLFQRDFTLVVVGQIISLFGNNILRYALPLYLLNQTGSPTLYGMVLGLSFIPMLLLSPVGGIIADRVNKRNVMVFLDFFTAALVGFYALSYLRMELVPLLVVVLMLLYGIQGAYQPAVQASLPVLLHSDHLMAGNAVINGVNSLAGILGPVLGGLMYGLYGLEPILYLSVLCFLISAIMEIFIHIPFQKRGEDQGILALAKLDLLESWHFIRHTRPEIGQVGVLMMVINLVFSALIIIGLPVVITRHLGFPEGLGNSLYGYAQGALAAGGLLGALLSGSLGQRLDIRHSHRLLLLCALALVPIGLVLWLKADPWIIYGVITLTCGLMMVFSTLISIQMLTYVQQVTPEGLIGKVMALITCLVLCANPLGQAVYGVLFEHLAGQLPMIYGGAFLLSVLICRFSKRIFGKLGDVRCSDAG